MKTALFALLLVVSAFATDYPTEEGVYVLGDSTLSQALGEFDFALVEFYAPWCGHCKKLAPEYAAAAQSLAKTNPEVKLVKVDCTVEKDTASKYAIKGFPTLKFFIKGNTEPVDYEGGRTKDEIINWLRKKTGPASVELKSVDAAEQTIGNNEVVAILFSDAGSEAYNNFLSVAQSFDDLPFAHTHDQAVREKYDAKGDTLIIFKKFDEGKNVHTGSFSTNDIREFLNAKRFPTILPFDQKIAQRIFGGGIDSIFLIRGDNEAGAKAEETLRSVAEDIKNHITVSIAKIEDGMGGRLADYIGVTKDNLPAIRIVQPKQNNQKFVFENEITGENIKTFVNNFKAGKLSPFFKTEEIPAQSHEEGVRVVVGKNFKEVVLDENTDVLMEYYAPWCGHCKTLAPIYSAVATKLKDISGVVLGKMDATANEVEGLSISGFPTLKYYPRGNKKSPVDYNGERTEEGFIDFLKKNSKADFSSLGGKNPSLDEL
jgi:protein disulfide-isomerase A1